MKPLHVTLRWEFVIIRITVVIPMILIIYYERRFYINYENPLG